jgi:alkylhydroperoxidase family enzyme
MHVLLGRAAGLTEEKLAHLGDDPLPAGVYAPEEAAIVRYAQRSTRMDTIDETVYGALADHFSDKDIIELCFTVGLANVVNRFHATFRTDLDPWTESALGPSCPLTYPSVPPSGEHHRTGTQS